VNLDAVGLGFVLKETLRRMSEQFTENPDDLNLLLKFETATRIAKDFPFEVDVWRAQNNFYSMMQTAFPEKESQARAGDARAQTWIDHFVALGQNLSVKVEAPTEALAA
jgi:hypothetical protein